MTLIDDEFDLDLRLFAASREPFSVGVADRIGRVMPRADEDTVAPQATCPANTCGLDCETDTCPDATCGCNTDTCDQVQCSDAITFGAYCEDASGGEDTCDACVPPGTDLCGDPPDV